MAWMTFVMRLHRSEIQLKVQSRDVISFQALNHESELQPSRNLDTAATP